MNVLLPKDKATILESFLYLDVNEFEKRRDEFKDMFDEDIPKEYYPLSTRILADLKDTKAAQISSYYYGNGEIHFKNIVTLNRGHFRTTEFFMTQTQTHVSIKVFPYTKIPSLKSITYGNEFRINNFDQYLEVKKVYKL